MVAKGVDCYSFQTNTTFSTRLTVPGHDFTFENPGAIQFTNVQVDSANIPGLFSFTGKYEWHASVAGAHVFSQYNDINTLTGNLEGGGMMSIMNMPSVIGANYAISYGFYDAGTDVFGLPNQDQSYVYFTDVYTTWMGDLTTACPQAAQVPFCQFALPGAHDSGMNTMATVNQILNSPYANELVASLVLLTPGVALMSPYAIQNLAMTQKDSFTQMLNLGVRYFDFRPGHMYPVLLPYSSDLFHQHAVVPGASYVQFLSEILTWLVAHPSEVVVVSCNVQGFASDTMNPTPAKLDDCLTQARQATGVTAATVQNGDRGALSQTLSTLRSNNMRLIFLNQIDGETTKYDSYPLNPAAYQTLDPATIITALNAMNLTAQAAATYTVLQLQGTANGIGAVIAGTLASTSWAASPLMATKAKFDQTTLAWAAQNVAYNLSSGYLTVLLNDFADNALVKTCIDITRQRMQLL